MDSDQASQAHAATNAPDTLAPGNTESELREESPCDSRSDPDGVTVPETPHDNTKSTTAQAVNHQQPILETPEQSITNEMHLDASPHLSATSSVHNPIATRTRAHSSPPGPGNGPKKKTGHGSKIVVSPTADLLSSFVQHVSTSGQRKPLMDHSGAIKKKPKSPNHVSARALAGGPSPFTARSISSSLGPTLTQTTRYTRLAHIIQHTLITVESNHFRRTSINKPSSYRSVTPLTFRRSAIFSMGPGTHQKRASAHAELHLRRRSVFFLASKIQRQCREHLQAVTRLAECYFLASVPKAITTDCIGII